MIETVAIVLALVLNLAIGTGLHSLPHEAMRMGGAIAGLLLVALVVGAFVYSVSSGVLLLLIAIVSGWLITPLGRIVAANLRGGDVSAEHARDFDRIQGTMQEFHREKDKTDAMLREIFENGNQGQEGNATTAADKGVPATCPNCGRSYSVPAEYAGRKSKCNCGEIIRIPRRGQWSR